MSKHTKGTWEVRKMKRGKYEKDYSSFEILEPLINESGEYKGKLGGYQVIVGRQNCLPGYILEEKHAALIASAPDMLEALTEVLRYCVTPAGFPDKAKGRTVEQQKAYDMAMEAIAKAEGK